MQGLAMSDQVKQEHRSYKINNNIQENYGNYFLLKQEFIMSSNNQIRVKKSKYIKIVQMNSGQRVQASFVVKRRPQEKQ